MDTQETGPTIPAPPAPQPADPASGFPAATTADSQNWAMGAHLSAFAAAWVGIALLGPLVVWLVKRDDDAFVEAHARDALNFNITWAIGGIVGGIAAAILAVLTLGLGLVVILPIVAVLVVAWFVLTIRGAMAASRGQAFHYPLTYEFVR